MPRITLIGYRGTGKSTVAALLGDILGCGWCDADVVLEKKLGCSIAALVRERGEPVFRDEEAVVLGELLAGFSGVLSTGGGAVLRAANREALRKLGRPVVWLTAPADVVRRRLAADPATAARRPALAASAGGGPSGHGDPLAEVAQALEHREPLYRAIADFQVDTSIAAPAAVAAQVAEWLREAWPGAEGAMP
ncbi:MAG: shikimate kinase [Planctomycetia bacterium]